jgi:two-component system LytT family response regulator
VKALLVDDERLARARLRTLLGEHPEVTIVGEADSVATAQAAIATHSPDVIFLDIEMPGGSGFDLLARMRVEANVVFVTAYDEHALRAFEVDAVDYLLKPIEPARLAEAIHRLQTRPPPSPDRVSVMTGGAMRVLAVADIILVRAERDYSELVLRDGTTLVQKLPLSRWEERLGAAFTRVHRANLVSVGDIVRVERSRTSTFRLFLRDYPHAVPVSRARAAALKAVLRS